MSEIFESPFFGIALSIFAFWCGQMLNKKTGLLILNPLIIAIVLIIGILLLFKIPYEAYQQGGSIINMFLAPATACLAVSIYAKIQILKDNWLPILIGCSCGSLLPKSVTTPIAVSIAESHGGVVPVTVVAVIFTGILGSILAPVLIRLFHVNDSMTAGLAIGASSHAIGTSKALEIGETEGAMSGLAIGICGIITVILSLFL